MILPGGLVAAVRDPDFWRAFLHWDQTPAIRREAFDEIVNHVEPWSEEALREWAFHFPDPPDDPFTRTCRVTFPLGPRYAVRLELSPSLGEHNLDLVRPDGTAAQLGWVDAHNHEDALRCDEWDWIGRCQALLDPALPHPGLPALLLDVYAPITDSENPAARLALQRAAARSFGLEAAVPRLLEWTDNRPSRFVWRSGPLGWYLEQDGDWLRDRLPSPLHTIRHPDNPEYPFADVAAGFEDARRFCQDAVRPEWRTGAVMGLAEAVAAGGFDRLPLLADALEEAGGDNPNLLAHLRDPEPARGAWVVELILGCEWGAVLAGCP